MIDFTTIFERTPKGSPLCFIVDDFSGVGARIASIVREFGIEPREFSNSSDLPSTLSKQVPKIICLEIPLGHSDAVKSIYMLEQYGYGGKVQLVSNCGRGLLDAIQRIGERHHLNMLPILPQPFQQDAIRRILMGEEVYG